MTEETIKQLWPLSTGFEYAADVGLALRMIQPAWWLVFEEETLAEPLPQSQGLNFISWVEDNQDLPERERWIALALSHCGAKVISEVESELLSRRRDLSNRDDPEPPPSLNGEEVYLYAPEVCAGYPLGKTSELDTWTEEALTGASLNRCPSEVVAIDQFYLVHSPEYIRGLANQAERGGGFLTPETEVTPTTIPAIQAAAGALLTASRDAWENPSELRLCLVHPGSHHAGMNRGCGSCLVNNLALAAKVALSEDRGPVVILDVDAHHGNGSEAILMDEGRVLTISLHQQDPFFPGTGRSLERGYGQESNLNIPIAPGDVWRDHLDRALAATARFHPRLILVEFSADAHRADPVSDLAATDDDFLYLGQQLREMKVATVFELGASLSRRAWVGAIRSLVAGWQKGAPDNALGHDQADAAAHSDTTTPTGPFTDNAQS